MTKSYWWNPFRSFARGLHRSDSMLIRCCYRKIIKEWWYTWDPYKNSKLRISIVDCGCSNTPMFGITVDMSQSQWSNVIFHSVSWSICHNHIDSLWFFNSFCKIMTRKLDFDILKHKTYTVISMAYDWYHWGFMETPLCCKKLHCLMFLLLSNSQLSMKNLAAEGISRLAILIQHCSQW
jgi:hypothetical protein